MTDRQAGRTLIEESEEELRQGSCTKAASKVQIKNVAEGNVLLFLFFFNWRCYGLELVFLYV
jgi:hypothetical protein